MNTKEAKELMKANRQLIKHYKEERMKISKRISDLENQIRDIKERIFRGEIAVPTGNLEEKKHG